MNSRPIICGTYTGAALACASHPSHKAFRHQVHSRIAPLTSGSRLTSRVLSCGVKVTVLVGGVGGARFLLGVQQLLGLGQFASASAPVGEHELTAVVNIGDDAWMHGVRICPDLDTCMYPLGGGGHPARGGGHRAETWHATY